MPLLICVKNGDTVGGLFFMREIWGVFRDRGGYVLIRYSVHWFGDRIRSLLMFHLVLNIT